MAEFTFHTTDTDDAERKALLEKAQAGYGMIPNMIAGLSESPQAAQAYMALSKAVVKGSLSKEEQHVVWFTANAEHGCEYCMTGHTGLAMMDKIDPAVIESARKVESYANPKLEALRVFTLQMIRQRGWASDGEVQAFLDAGFSKRNIMDVIIGIAHKTISNYANHLMQTPLDKGSEPLAWSKPE